MKIAKKLSRAVIALAVCMLLVVTAWAANEIFVTYSATLNDSVLCVNELDEAVTLTVQANKTEGVIEMDSLTAQVTVPDGLKLKGIANESLKFNENNYNIENGMILWYSSTADDVTNNLLAEVTINVPAGTPAGTYEIAFDIIDISREWGTSWENGTKVYATLTVAGHADGDDDTDHFCDYCAENVVVEDCHDTIDGDHKCDECGAENVTTCADSDSDGDHKCDDCAKDYSVCGDGETKDHVCDTDSVCTVYSTGNNEHKDTDGEDDHDHICDYCHGEVEGETCHDANNDGEHNCDECGKENVTACSLDHVKIENYKPATVAEEGYTGDTHCADCGAFLKSGGPIDKLNGEIVSTPATDNKYDEVPEAAADEYKTPEEMQTAMTDGTVNHYELTDAQVSTVFYDVELYYTDPVTNEKVKADAEHFPEGGEITVELPVPEGTDHAHYTYFVAHVYSTDDFKDAEGNHAAGDIEYPVVSEVTIEGKTGEYISFTVTGLSPISVSYVKTDCDWVLDTEKGTNGYTVNEDTHTAHYKCAIDGTETKDVTENHAYDATTGLCVCGTKKPEEVTGLKGDVNLDGQVTLSDAVLLTRHTLEVETVTDPIALKNADVNGDGEVSLADAVKLTRYTLDLETLD